MKRIVVFAAVLSALIIAGCGGDSALPEATGKGTVRALNTIQSSPAFAFLIEERLVNSASYKSTSGANQYDDLDYTFNFEVQLVPGEARTRVASQILDVTKDKDYTFVISGNTASPTITIWEGDTRQWQETDTVFESRFAHVATTIGSVDVYFAPEGTAPVLGEQVGTMATGDILPPIENPEGDYVVTITSAGDPLDVIFQSDPLTRGAQGSSIITLFDSDPNDVSPVSVRSFNAAGAATTLTDVNSPPTMRFFNASSLLGTSDIYNDDPPTTPLVMNHAFGDITGDIPVAEGINSLTYTTAGNIGSITLEEDVSALGSRHTHIYVVDTEEPRVLASLPDRRSIETVARFGIVYAAANHPAADLYIVEADLGLEDQQPALFNLSVGAITNLELPADSYDMYLTTSGEQTIITGPYRLDVALGDVVDFIVLDNVDPATADFIPVPAP